MKKTPTIDHSCCIQMELRHRIIRELMQANMAARHVFNECRHRRACACAQKMDEILINASYWAHERARRALTGEK